MIFYLLLCNTLFIPLIVCSNTTISKSEVVNKTLSDFQQENVSNRTKEPLLSEGGLRLVLPEGNHTITNGNEVSKNKVVARKGVVYPGNITKSEEPLSSINESIIAQPSTPGNASNNRVNDTVVVVKGKNTTLNNLSKDVQSVNKTEPIRKPLILNSDVLENQTDKSSSETLADNQYVLPDKNIKSYVTNATQHPGMVMPIVITILLVPMFAVLGYMALRRGQEAWKNRHYKRMDFLLDGMYND